MRGLAVQYLVATVPATGPTATDIVAWAGLALAAISVAAQFLARYLDGGRARVRLVHVLRDDVGVFTLDSGQWPVPKTAIRGDAARDPSAYVEMAEVIVENKGRHPITVYQIGFQWRGERSRWYKRRAVHHAIPRIFKMEGFGERSYLDVTEARIEPADRISVLFDYWSLLPADRASIGGRRKLRATAHVAGRARRTLSSRRRQWVIPDSAVSGIKDVTRLTARGLIARAIARADNNAPPSVLSPGYLARLVESHIEGSWPEDYKERHDLLRAYFKESNERFLFGDNALTVQVNIEMEIERELSARSEQVDWADIFIRKDAEPSESTT